MYNKNYVKFYFIILLFLAVILIFYFKFSEKKESNIIQEETSEKVYNSNLIKDVEYSTKDKTGNKYLIKAKVGEIDFSNSNIIFLKKVYSSIKLIDSEEVTIVSDFGKYNSENYNTIFSKNVIIRYLDNKITGEYLDFSLERNSMIISNNVIYSNTDNILKADVVEINIRTKDTKIFMHEDKKKVIIKNNK